MASLVAFISTIGDLITVVGAFQSLFPSGSQIVITLQDFGGLLRLEVARLQSTRLNFYDVWLPAISRRAVIDDNDITPQVRPSLLFRQNAAVLHVDDFVQGMFLVMELYGLLLHMHAVWTTLRRIQVGASSLDDPRLNIDTRSAITYTSSARTFVREMNELSWIRRLDSVKHVRSDWSLYPGGAFPLRFYIYSFSDRYLPLPNSVHPLTHPFPGIGGAIGDNPPMAYRRTTLDAASWIAQARERHIVAIRNIYNLRTSQAPGFATELDKLMVMLEARLVRQGGVKGLDRLHGVDDVYSSEKEEKEALLELSINHKDGDKEEVVV
ncbi:hypothetical protein BDP27DRAFT_1460938 [Rhodocollybia butyracea]|uniref:Uncharacterized protein n=1 Tax=Rhodocollybia butyracea TaxID=206335 RepID=A0A9P5UDE9_9AGAR|nr:hypothetical protein BDP27DRAFT_1460938 [Rhodocollybia butyracea]